MRTRTWRYHVTSLGLSIFIREKRTLPDQHLYDWPGLEQGDGYPASTAGPRGDGGHRHCRVRDQVGRVGQIGELPEQPFHRQAPDPSAGQSLRWAWFGRDNRALPSLQGRGQGVPVGTVLAC